MTNDEIKEKIKQKEFVNVEKIELITNYILDLKQQQVEINMPNNPIHVMLMEHAFQVSLAYYLDKFKEGINGS
jgi:hypothetical protein